MRQMLRAGALGRSRGMGWRGRWEGALGWVTHVNPWLIHVNVWQNPLQYHIVISLQLIKRNGKKRIYSKIKWQSSKMQNQNYFCTNLIILHMVMHMFSATLSILPTLVFLHCLHKSIFYVCISIAALQIGSSVPSFQIPYICVNI